MDFTKDVQFSTLDDVPVLWIEQPGPTQIALKFRVGQADEQIHFRGITHLVEHLAMHGLGEREYDFNAQVDMLFTDFGCRGSQEEAREFIESVTQSLANLDESRLERELNVLRVERANDQLFEPFHPTSNVLFGVEGAGILGFSELVKYNADWKDILSHRDHYFTKQNAIICGTGQRPDNLSLSLPNGERHLPKTAHVNDVSAPTWVQMENGYLTAGLVAPMNSAQMTAGRILKDRLQRDMRTLAGHSYHVWLNSYDLDASTVFWTVTADYNPPEAESASWKFIGALERFFEDGVTAEEVAVIERSQARKLADPNTTGSKVVSMAEFYLLDRPDLPGLRVPAVEEVNEAIKQRDYKLVAKTPIEPMKRFGWEAPKALARQEPATDGLRFKCDGSDIWIGNKAISVSEPASGAIETIRWDDVAVVLHDPTDDSYVIVGRKMQSAVLFDSPANRPAIQALLRFAPNKPVLAGPPRLDGEQEAVQAPQEKFSVSGAWEHFRSFDHSIIALDKWALLATITFVATFLPAVFLVPNHADLVGRSSFIATLANMTIMVKFATLGLTVRRVRLGILGACLLEILWLPVIVNDLIGPWPSLGKTQAIFFTITGIGLITAAVFEYMNERSLSGNNDL